MSRDRAWRKRLPSGTWCPTCGRLLAAGAPCPEHGDPAGLPDTFHRRRLPAWARVLGLGSAAVDRDQIRSAFRRRARETHPDAGGTAAAFRKVRAAFDAAMAALEKRA